ncbi:hypothetical protein ABIB68_002424 [Bradyrhizobium sp. F1.2.2]
MRMDTERHPSHQHTVAILSRGDAAARRDATAQNSRFVRVFEALAAVGIEARPAIYDENFAEDVREQLLATDGVLVWVDPIHQGKTRVELDPLLRDVAARGPWVSAHPDVILKMGTKEVLYRTRSMGWGCDTALYQTAEAMRAELPTWLATGPRVIKRNRGNGGQGVWKVEKLPTSPMIKVLDATKDGSEELTLDSFLGRCAEYFENGSVVDQPFQPRLSEGVVRCYMSGNRCAGFGYHKVKALVDSPAARSEAGPRLYTSNADPRFQRLRRLMEDEWTPGMMKTLEIDEGSLPVIWDADFLYGPKDTTGADTYVLCEINASSCFAIPEEAPAAIARTVKQRLTQTQRASSAK